MPLTEDQIREALKQVIDPELFVNIVDLGLIYNVTTAPSPVLEQSATAETTEPSAPPVPAPAATADPAPTTDAAPAETFSGPTEDIFIDMTMTSPACPAGPQLIANTKQVLGRIPGVGKVEVKIVMIPPWTPDCMTEEAKDQLGIF
jgi:metal-sulfur cluster biosynthetic enzyme